MNGLWIAVLVLTFLVGGVVILAEIYDARREQRGLPVDIDRFTRATRARIKREKGERTG